MTPFTISLYGYKGGIGKSLLAANIGVLQAQRGKTLIWDLDIEAPCLQYIPGLDFSETSRQGFFDWLLQWQKSQRPVGDADFEALAGLAYQAPASERLFVLPASGTMKDSVGLYQEIQWDDLLVRNLACGLELFRKAIDAFGKAGFETVIIDTCPGLTDIGALVAVLLPHVTVLVGNYGRQNTKGLARVWEALESAATGRVKPRAPLPDLARILVASPVVDVIGSCKTDKKAWEEAFGIPFGEAITVPFEVSLSFGEELYAVKFPNSPVTKAYRKLDKRIETVRNSEKMRRKT